MILVVKAYVLNLVQCVNITTGETKENDVVLATHPQECAFILLS